MGWWKKALDRRAVGGDHVGMRIVREQQREWMCKINKISQLDKDWWYREHADCILK